MNSLQPPPPTGKIKVMVVENDPLARDGFKYLLDDDDIEVIDIGEDVSACLQLAEQYQPDVAVIDVNLDFTREGKEGIELTRQLTASIPTIRCLLISVSRGMGEWLPEAVKAGAHGYFRKNTVQGPQLKELIRKMSTSIFMTEPGFAEHYLGSLGSPGKMPPAVPGANPLSPREREVLALALHDLPYHEIARRLNISENTVKTHIARANDKIAEGRSASWVAMYAALKGWLNPES